MLYMLLILAADPPVIVLGDRKAQATPARVGFTHTGGGTIDVQQPAPNKIVVTLSGVAVAGGHPCKDSAASMLFDVMQEFEVKGKKVRLALDARLTGLLRGHGKGGAVSCPATASVGPVTVSLDGRSVAGGENLSVNDRQTTGASVVGGKFVLHGHFGVEATHPRSLLPCKAASAEFAPDPALDPLWISAWEPFRGAAKKDFGFQITVEASADE